MNIINPVKNYFKEAYQELIRVIWPTKPETIRHTILVVAVSLAVAAFLGSLDYLFSKILEFIV